MSVRLGPIELPNATDVRVYRSRPEWLMARQSCLGASDVAKAFGWSPSAGPWTIWRSKREPLGRDRQDFTQATGHHEEPRILEDHSRMTGLSHIGPLGSMIVFGPGSLGVTLDSLISDPEMGWGVGELKVDQSPYRWGRSESVIEKWTPAAAEIVREDYAAQVYAQMAATGLKWGRIIIRGKFDRVGVVRWYTLLEDLDLQASLVNQAAEWWERHIVQGEWPEIDETEACARAIARMFPPAAEGRDRDATDQEVGQAEQVLALDRDLKAATAERDRLKHQLGAAMVESQHEVLAWDGGKVRLQRAGRKDNPTRSIRVYPNRRAS